MQEYLADNFLTKNSTQNILSIQASLNGFSFSVRELSGGKLLAFSSRKVISNDLQQLTKRFREWKQEQELLQLNYAQTQFFLFSKQFSMLPSELESGTLIDGLSRVLLSEKPLETSSIAIPKLEALLFFAMPDELDTITEKYFPNYRLRHPIEKLIEEAQADPSPDGLYALLDQQDFYLVCKYEGKIQNCNVFKINHANDGLYFLIAPLNQLNAPASKVPVFLTGKSTYLEDLQAALQKVFPQIIIPEADQSIPATLPANINSEYYCLF